jgi:prevent-host-death family protein
MREMTATEVARRFSEVLDAVEHHNESVAIVRRGRTVARLGPAGGATGKALKKLARRSADEAWERDLRELRSLLGVEERSWPD